MYISKVCSEVKRPRPDLASLLLNEETFLQMRKNEITLFVFHSFLHWKRIDHKSIVFIMKTSNIVNKTILRALVDTEKKKSHVNVINFLDNATEIHVIFWHQNLHENSNHMFYRDKEISSICYSEVYHEERTLRKYKEIQVSPIPTNVLKLCMTTLLVIQVWDLTTYFLWRRTTFSLWKCVIVFREDLANTKAKLIWKGLPNFMRTEPH